MSEATTTTRRPRAPRVPIAPKAPARPTLPATDAANPEQPLTLSSDALEGTRDRDLAMDWTDEGHTVRKRSDGVYEKVYLMPSDAPAPPEVLEFYPDVELLDRRVLDPNVDRDVTILFKDEVGLKPGQKPKYYKRWVDTHIPHRFLTLTQRAHYKVATWDMLADKNDIGDRSEGLGAEVCRGDKGRYKLLFMPYAKWEEIKIAQARQRTTSERTQMSKLAAAQAAGTPGIGARGAEQVDAMFTGSIKELPPQSIETFQASGLPKDLQSGAASVLEQ